MTFIHPHDLPTQLYWRAFGEYLLQFPFPWTQTNGIEVLPRNAVCFKTSVESVRPEVSFRIKFFVISFSMNVLSRGMSAEKIPVGSKGSGDFGYKLLFRLWCIRQLDLICKIAASRRHSGFYTVLFVLDIFYVTSFSIIVGWFLNESPVADKPFSHMESSCGYIHDESSLQLFTCLLKKLPLNAGQRFCQVSVWVWLK